MIGRDIGVVITGAIGILIAVLGWLLWKKEKIAILHAHHVDKVSADNKAAFCKLSGSGLIVIGAGLMITAVILGVTDSACSFICFAASFAVGMGYLIGAGVKYNR